VRVDRDPVVPVVTVAEARHVEVADGDDRVLLHAVDLVAVDVHGRLELVVAAVLLELADRRRDDLRVHDADRRGGTRDAVVRLDERLVAVQPQARGLHEQVETGDDRELDAGRLGDAQLALADAHRAVEVGHECGDEEAEQQDGRDEREEDRVERHREHVEARVDLELRVDLTGGDAVGPQPDRLPVAGRREPREEAEEDGHAPHRQAAQRLDDLLVAVELRAQPDVDRAEPVGELDDDEQRHGHAEEADDEHHRRRDPLRGEHAGEPDLVEPEEFGVEGREDEERRDERGDDHQGDSEDASGGSRRGRGLGWGRGHPSILGTARCGRAVTPVTAGSRPAPVQVAGMSQ
ncbi:unnamed protein product, partial [Penicillium discolor]